MGWRTRLRKKRESRPPEEIEKEEIVQREPPLVPSNFSIMFQEPVCSNLLYLVIMVFLLGLSYNLRFPFHIDIKFLEEMGSPVLFALLLPTSLTFVLVFPFIFWRSRIVKKVFLAGVAVRGRAVLVDSHYRYFIPRIRISYRYKGHWYYRTKFCFLTRMSTEDQEVVVVLDPDNPKRAFVEDLYF